MIDGLFELIIAALAIGGAGMAFWQCVPKSVRGRITGAGSRARRSKTITSAVPDAPVVTADYRVIDPEPEPPALPAARVLPTPVPVSRPATPKPRPARVRPTSAPYPPYLQGREPLRVRVAPPVDQSRVLANIVARFLQQGVSEERLITIIQYLKAGYVYRPLAVEAAEGFPYLARSNHVDHHRLAQQAGHIYSMIPQPGADGDSWEDYEMLADITPPTGLPPGIVVNDRLFNNRGRAALGNGAAIYVVDPDVSRMEVRAYTVLQQYVAPAAVPVA